MTYRKALRLAAVVACAFMSITAQARAEVPVAFDCYLQSGRIECGTLTRAFFDSVGYARPSDRNSARVRIAVRAIALPASTRYTVSFAGERGGPSFELADEVPRALESDAVLLRVLSVIHRGTVPFLEVRGSAQTTGGMLRIEAVDPNPGGPAHGNGNDPPPVYVRPSIQGELVSQGLDLVSLGAEIELNYSTPAWRLLASGDAKYRHLRADLGDSGMIEGGLWNAQGALATARTIAGGLSVAALGNWRRSPSSNLDSWLEGGLGVEWVRRPFLEAESNNVGLRYRLLGGRQDYVTPNVLGDGGELLVRHAATGFLRWHMDAIDVSTDATAGMALSDPRFWDVSGQVAATWRLVGAIELSLTASARYRGAALHEPADSSELDQVAVLLGGSDFLPFTYYASLSLSYTFGNALLRSQDQRWR